MLRMTFTFSVIEKKRSIYIHLDKYQTSKETVMHVTPNLSTPGN